MYVGDYDIAQADNNFFYVAWGDNRDPSHFNPAFNQANVYFDRIAISNGAVPLPGTLVLLLGGLLAMMVSRRHSCP